MQNDKKLPVNSVQIAPSILSADFGHLVRDCEMVLQNGADLLHIDVMDGVFVPNISIGIPVIASLRKAFPGVFFDVHLMITNPLRYIDAFAKAGASLISFHVEAEPTVEETVQAIHNTGCKAGIVLKPGTTVEEILPYLHMVDLVLVMSVEPGFGGQAFMPSALAKLQDIKEYAVKNGLQQLLIEVDGGINETTAGQVVKAGANVLVAGSAVFGKKDVKQAIRQLRGENG